MTAITAVAGQRLTAAFLNANCIPGPWVPIAPSNGYANVSGQIIFQARLLNSVTAEVEGTLIKPSGGTDGDIIGNMPTGMIPTSTQGKNGNWTQGSTIHGANLNITVRNTGAIVLFSSALPSTSYTQFCFSFAVTLDG